MSTIIRTLPSAAFTAALEGARAKYKYQEMNRDLQMFFDQAFSEGWNTSKDHTFEILEQIAQEGEHGKQ